MLKMVTVFSRRPDMSPDAFYDYWHNHHGPLVREVAETLRVRRYVQSPRVPSRVIDEFVSGRGWIDDYDALTEVWWDSEPDMLEAFGTPEGEAASQRLAEDEANFIDMTRVISFLSEEREVIGPGSPSTAAERRSDAPASAAATPPADQPGRRAQPPATNRSSRAAAKP